MSTYTIVATFALSFMLLSTICIMDNASAHHDCEAGHGCYIPFKSTNDQQIVHHNRKFLMGLMGSRNGGEVGQEKAQYGVQMRNVPSGPDPLHHNNGPQKRPKISP